MKIAILGAGLSGLTVAKKLQELDHECVVFEKNKDIGGLTRTRITDGFTYDLCGAHIFWADKDSEIASWVFSLLPRDYWHVAPANAKIFFGDYMVSYPIESSLYEFPIDTAVELSYDFLNAKGGGDNNFQDWLIGFFGKKLADLYLIPYNRKIWNYPLDQMEANWMSDKLPMPDKKSIIRSLISKSQPNEALLYNIMYYPKHGGIQALVNAISKDLSIKINCPIERIESDNGQWIVNGEAFDEILSTMYLQDLSKVMQIPNDVNNAIQCLRYNSLTTILVDCKPTDASWLYIPDAKYKAHRIGFPSVLTPYAAPKNHFAGAIEIIGDKFDVTDSVISEDKYIPHELEIKGIIDSQYSEYAYVIHDLNYRKNTSVIFDYFSSLQSFHPLGKWGLWNYDNMLPCMRKAFALANSIGEAK